MEDWIWRINGCALSSAAIIVSAAVYALGFIRGCRRGFDEGHAEAVVGRNSGVLNGYGAAVEPDNPQFESARRELRRLAAATERWPELLGGRCDPPPVIVRTTLLDQADGDLAVPTRVEILPSGIVFYFEGYGDAYSAEGHGAPVLIEVADNSLGVLVWDDINQEDATYRIALEGALESRRRPDPPERSEP